MLSKQAKYSFIMGIAATAVVLSAILVSRVVIFGQGLEISASTVNPPAATPACSDQSDNDGDGKTDFPEDPGCDSSSDTDETDPTAPPSPAPSASNPSSNNSDLQNRYPIGIIANQPNNLFVKARVGNQFEMVRMEPLVLPSSANLPVMNASIHDYLLVGEDSQGKQHFMVIKGRHWDPTTFADSNLTGEPWFSFFAQGGSVAQCAQAMQQSFSAVPFYLDNNFFFQQMIEMLSLCQRGASGAPIPSPTP